MRLSSVFLCTALFALCTGANANTASSIDAGLSDYQESVAIYARKLGQPIPRVQDYGYGMNLDVATVISRSIMPASCDAVPMRMTYKDSAGKLNTVQYMVQGKCRPKQE